MKKLYLLPISVILMTTGYADEPQEIQSENIVQEESIQTQDTGKNVYQQTSITPPHSAGPPAPEPAPAPGTKNTPSTTHGNQNGDRKTNAEKKAHKEYKKGWHDER